MRRQDFQIEIPESLIAFEPCVERSASRLMLLKPGTQSIEHHYFNQFIDFIKPEDCLIFNDTKVIPARLIGNRESGGKVEILIERLRFIEGKDTCIAKLRSSNKPKQGSQIVISEDFVLQVDGREGEFFILENLSDSSLTELIDTYGKMPLPPYIQREARSSDNSRYQTVYAKNAGAVAAPTAGLHFDAALLEKIKNKGIEYDFVTLHVGAGTFSPIRVDDVSTHKMHSEWFNVPQSVVELVARTRQRKGRVIAIGTTSIRCLESASTSGNLAAASGETDIFILPGYRFKSVDGLVSAFAGKEFVFRSYAEAINHDYRFFSYGDSMFIENTAC